MAGKIATVWVPCWGAETQTEVQLPGESERRIRVESPLWWAWLEEPTTLSFSYPLYDRQVGYISGWMTVREERRGRGRQDWVAYSRADGGLRKIYLGRSAQLTRLQLAATADKFVALKRPAGERQKEVMPGQSGGAWLEREAMMRRKKSGQQVVQFGRR